MDIVRSVSDDVNQICDVGLMLRHHGMGGASGVRVDADAGPNGNTVRNENLTAEFQQRLETLASMVVQQYSRHTCDEVEGVLGQDLKEYFQILERAHTELCQDQTSVDRVKAVIGQIEISRQRLRATKNMVQIKDQRGRDLVLIMEKFGKVLMEGAKDILQRHISQASPTSPPSQPTWAGASGQHEDSFTMEQPHPAQRLIIPSQPSFWGTSSW